MLQEAGSIADLIGAVGVIVSLIFVGLQLRQANKLARSAARQQQITEMGRMSEIISENGELSDILSRGAAGRELSAAENARLVAYITHMERIQEGLYWQYQDGLVDPELWEAHRQMTRAAQNLPIVRAVWTARKHYFSKRFQEFRDQEQTKAGDAVLTHSVQTTAGPTASPPTKAPKP